MKQKVKIGIVVGAAAVAVGVLGWNSRQALAAEDASTSKPKTTSPAAPKSVPAPKPKKKASAATVALTPEPYTQLQYESAGALGFAPADEPDVSRQLNEDLVYLGIGGT